MTAYAEGDSLGSIHFQHGGVTQPEALAHIKPLQIDPDAHPKSLTIVVERVYLSQHALDQIRQIVAEEIAKQKEPSP